MSMAAHPLAAILGGFEPIPGAKLHFEFMDAPALEGYRGALYATLLDAKFEEEVLISFKEATEFALMTSMEEKMTFMRSKFAEAYEKLKAKVEAYYSDLRT